MDALAAAGLDERATLSPQLKDKHIHRLRALRERLQALKQLREPPSGGSPGAIVGRGGGGGRPARGTAGDAPDAEDTGPWELRGKLPQGPRRQADRGRLASRDDLRHPEDGAESASEAELAPFEDPAASEHPRFATTGRGRLEDGGRGGLRRREGEHRDRRAGAVGGSRGLPGHRPGGVGSERGGGDGPGTGDEGGRRRRAPPLEGDGGVADDAAPVSTEEGGGFAPAGVAQGRRGSGDPRGIAGHVDRPGKVGFRVDEYRRGATGPRGVRRESPEDSGLPSGCSRLSLERLAEPTRQRKHPGESPGFFPRSGVVPATGCLREPGGSAAAETVRSVTARRRSKSRGRRALRACPGRRRSISLAFRSSFASSFGGHAGTCLEQTGALQGTRCSRVTEAAGSLLCPVQRPLPGRAFLSPPWVSC